MENEAKQILLDKLKEMAKIECRDCDDGNEYALICSAMSDIARVIINAD